MATPLFYLDEDLKSITVVSQSPERTLRVIDELIKDKVITPGEWTRARFELPCDVAPLEIRGHSKKYKTIYVMAGYIGGHSYVSFKDPFGADSVYNANYTFKILEKLGFKLTDEMKALLRDDSQLCDKNGFYSAKLVNGQCLLVTKNYGANTIQVNY